MTRLRLDVCLRSLRICPNHWVQVVGGAAHVEGAAHPAGTQGSDWQQTRRQTVRGTQRTLVSVIWRGTQVVLVTIRVSQTWRQVV